MKKGTNMHFGDKVKQLAAERNMTQKDIVERSPLSKSHVNAIWHNKVGDPRLETLIGLRIAFDLSLDEISEGVDFGPATKRKPGEEGGGDASET